MKLFNLTHHKKTLVNVKEYSLRYKDSDEPVFEDVSFVIEGGERVSLSEKNGSGKTTIIRKILQKCNGDAKISEIFEDGICEVVSGLVVYLSV